MLTYFAFKLVRILQNSASVCRCSNIVLNGTHRLHLLEHAPQEHLLNTPSTTSTIFTYAFPIIFLLLFDLLLFSSKHTQGGQ